MAQEIILNMAQKKKNLTKSRFPKLLVKVDRKFEKEKAGAFFIEKAFRTNDFWFFEKFVKDYPELVKIKNMDIESAKKFFNSEVDKYYFKKERKLKNLIKDIERKWDKIKNEFFIEAEKIFDGHKWPKGKYAASISLFGMYRFVPETKTFSIPSNDYGGNPPAHGQINAAIVHEMMHILFEDFYKKNFKKNSLPLQKYYDLLEITNYIVLNLPQINKLTGWVFYPYPNHKERAEYLKKVYFECKNMKEFIGKAIPYLNETKDL